MKNNNPRWWDGASIYQIYPRSFQDSNGDGIGDLAGITQRLPYVASLGVDAIWISPFFPSPMRDFGYDVTDYCGVDPLFGTLEDFDRLVAQAHQLGLRVLIDQVLNHSSIDHPWFVESRSSRDNPKADWYVWADAKEDGTPPNNWLSIFGGSAWHWDTRRQQYYLHNFLTSQPDLNLHHPEVQQAALDVLRFWLERGVDGFRLDVVNFYFHDRQLRDNPPQPKGSYAAAAPRVNPYTRQRHLHDKTQPENLVFLQRLRALLDEYPGRTTVGEIGDDEAYPTLRKYTTGGRLHMAYTFNLMDDFCSAPFVHGVLEEFLREAKGSWVCWALSNHDVVRAASRWGTLGPRRTLAPLLIALLGSLKGSICLYQGEELGLTEAVIPYELLRDPYGIEMWPEFVGRDGCRTPMPWAAEEANGGFSTAAPWLPMPPEHLPMAVDAQERDAESVLHFYRRFLAWRRSQPALVGGGMELLPTHLQVVAFVRDLGANRVLCAFNLSQETVELPHHQHGRLIALRDSGFAGEVQGEHLLLGPNQALFAAID